MEVALQRASSVAQPSPDWTAAVIAAAGELFLIHGYAGVSLAAVMAQTGGSFREVYREFGSKEGLFLRAMQYLCQQVVTPWRTLDSSKLPLEEALVVFGRALLGTLLSPRLLALHRLILAEAVRFPQLAQVWFKAGPHATSEALGALLEARAKSEHLALTDPVAQAGIFIDSVVNSFQLRCLVGTEVSQAEVELHVRTCARVFLYGIAPQQPKRSRKGPDAR